MAFYGGVIGGLLGIIILHKVKKKKVEPFLDFIAVYVPWARPSAVSAISSIRRLSAQIRTSWGMISTGPASTWRRIRNWGRIRPSVPTFLYEFIGNMILFFILHRFRRKSKIPYGTVALYLAGYGLIRFLWKA